MSSATGNRCGHNPARPRLDPLELPSDRLLPVLYDVIGAIENLFWMRHHAQFADVGQARRSEICEAMVLVGKALFARMDIVTKRVGSPRSDGTVVGVTAERLAAITGLHLSRVNRALAEFAGAGWMTSCQPCELRSDGSYRGYPAIRTFLPRMFIALRCNLKLAAAAKRASDERKAARELAQRGLADLQRERLQRERARIERRNAARLKRLGGAGQLTTDDEQERRRALAALQLRIRKRHPDWPTEVVRAEATKQLDRRG